jgi:hypothetical protein
MTPSPTTTGECLCFSSATVNVTAAGSITFDDCYGYERIENFDIGNDQTFGDGTFCITKDTNAGSAEYTIVSYNDCCSSGCCYSDITIDNESQDVEIGNVQVDSTSTIYVGGQPLPNTAGNGTNLKSDCPPILILPNDVTLTIDLTSGLAGQKVTITDCNGASQCQSFGVGSFTLNFDNVYMDCGCEVIILVEDGTC